MIIPEAAIRSCPSLDNIDGYRNRRVVSSDAELPNKGHVCRNRSGKSSVQEDEEEEEEEERKGKRSELLARLSVSPVIASIWEKHARAKRPQTSASERGRKEGRGNSAFPSEERA